MERTSFKNAENRAFYKSLPLGKMDLWIEASGLVQTPELDLIFENLSSVPEILELGAGEGRVVDSLLSRGYMGTIYALERDEMRCDLLRKKFGNYSNVKVLQKDILEDELPNSHTGLWLWAGFFEFNPSEQRKALQKLSDIISDQLILDLPAKGSKSNATFSLSNYIEIETPWGIDKGYMCSRDEIIGYLERTKFHLDRIIPYKTSSNRERELYLLNVK